MNQNQNCQEQEIKGWLHESEGENYEYAFSNILRRKTIMGALPKIVQTSKKIQEKKKLYK